MGQHFTRSLACQYSAIYNDHLPYHEDAVKEKRGWGVGCNGWGGGGGAKGLERGGFARLVLTSMATKAFD